MTERHSVWQPKTRADQRAEAGPPQPKKRIDPTETTLRATRLMAVLLVCMVVFSGIAIWAGWGGFGGGALANGLSWAFGLAAGLTAIGLLRMVAQMLVDPSIRLDRVLVYGAILVAAIASGVWLWQFVSQGV